MLRYDTATKKRRGPTMDYKFEDQEDPDVPSAMEQTADASVRRMLGIAKPDTAQPSPVAQMSGDADRAAMAQKMGIATPQTGAALPQTGQTAQPQAAMPNDPAAPKQYGNWGTPPEMPAEMTPTGPNTGIAPDGGSGLPSPPVLKGSAATRKQIEEHEAMPAARQPKFWNRLASGALTSLAQWSEQGAQGGFAGLLGAVATGGISGAASPGGLAEWKKARKTNKMRRQLGMELGEEEAVEKQRQAKIKTSRDDVNLRQDAAKTYIESSQKKGYMTDEEVGHVKNVYQLDITDPNNAEYVEREQNGKWMIRRKNDPRYVENPTIETDPGEQYRDTTLPDGDVVPLKPGQVASTTVGLAQANAGRVERAEQRTAQAEEREYDDMASWQKAQTEARANRAKHQTVIKQLQIGRDELAAQGLPTTEIDQQLAKAQGEVAAADTVLRSKQPKRPNSPTDRGVPSIFTEKEARSHYEGKGLTPGQVNAAITKAKQAGTIR